MGPWLGFGAFGISAGLFIYGREGGIIPEDLHFPFLAVLIAAGVALAFFTAAAKK
jgi:hypothetical protein